MTDVALAAAGSSIAAATCADERHPPENTLDGTESTFWMTTGLFPQELVIALPKEVCCACCCVWPRWHERTQAASARL